MINVKLLVAGFSVRHIACSAARAGHQVIAADSFCDLDLEKCASETILLDRARALQTLPALIEEQSPDAVVLGPGLEEADIRGIEVLNNPPELSARVSDKLWLARWLEREGFPFIRTEAEPSAATWNYPSVVKPRKGAGGVGCRLVEDRADLAWEEGLLIQEFVKGRPASVSVIGNGEEARAVAINEQIIGARFAGAECFRYSGNITPLEPNYPGLADAAEEIVAGLRLTGSNGVDFLLAEDGPVVVEVNPRFQGSLDTVELSTGLNIFKAHLKAFRGDLPERTMAVPCRTAGRIIYYAPEDLIVNNNLESDNSIEGLADIPRQGSIIKRGDPVASLLATGKSRADVLGSLMERSSELERALMIRKGE